ncbi:MAG: aminofutalosine synthase MqnE [Candidatus Methylomirabilales bacterium]
MQYAVPGSPAAAGEEKGNFLYELWPVSREAHVEALVGRAGLSDLYGKVVQGGRLSAEDGLRLYRTPDLTAVGALANLMRERMSGSATYYVRNLHVNYTNICNKLCKFCSFYAPPGDPRGYVLSPDDIVARLEEFRDQVIREIHMVAGINPKLPYPYYLDILRAVSAARPDAQIKAYTMIELAQIARVAKKPLGDVLEDLKDAGLACCPGGGAEVFSERVHEELFRAKLDNEGWFEVAREVHRAGLRSNATMLYGHIETVEEKVTHLLHIRELQDETKGFQCFVPLAFDPARTELAHVPLTTGQQNLREIAVARLLLDNFPHIKAFWIMITPQIAQLALWYGADDLDGTVNHYEITHALGTEAHRQVLSHRQLLDLIREVGRVPVERDALYHVMGGEQPAVSGQQGARGPTSLTVLSARD